MQCTNYLMPLLSSAKRAMVSTEWRMSKQGLLSNTQKHILINIKVVLWTKGIPNLRGFPWQRFWDILFDFLSLFAGAKRAQRVSVNDAIEVKMSRHMRVQVKDLRKSVGGYFLIFQLHPKLFTPITEGFYNNYVKKIEQEGLKKFSVSKESRNGYYYL